MKNIFKFAGLCTLLIAATASCQKQAEINEENPNNYPPVSISLTGNAIAATKGYATEMESAIRKVQFLVYDEDGRLVGEQARNNADELTLYLPVGYYHIHALVNMPTYTLEDVATESQLTSKSAYIADSYKVEAKGMQMYGLTTLHHSENGSRVDIEVKRIAAKLEIGQIKNMFLVSRVIIDKIYLINTPGDCKLDGTPLTYNNIWYNKNQLEPYNQVKDFNYYPVDYSINRYEVWGSINPYTITFYMYPNSSTSYRTRLIFDVIIDGTDYYYPFTLPTIKNNQLYRVNLLELMKVGVEVNTSDPGSRNGEYSGDIYHDVDTKTAEELEEMGILVCEEW